jgi:hypothetical protein
MRCTCGWIDPKLRWTQRKAIVVGNQHALAARRAPGLASSLPSPRRSNIDALSKRKPVRSNIDSASLRTSSEVQASRGPLDKEPCWGLVFFASELANQIALQEPKFSAYIAGGSEPSHEEINNPRDYLVTSLDRFTSIVESATEDLFSKSNLESCFGKDMTGGDTQTIRGLANGVGQMYADILTWGLAIRGAAVPSSWAGVFATVGEMPRKPTLTIRQFSLDASRDIGELSSRIRAGQSVSNPISLMLRLDMDDKVMAEYRAALARLR